MSAMGTLSSCLRSPRESVRAQWIPTDGRRLGHLPDLDPDQETSIRPAEEDEAITTLDCPKHHSTQ